MAHERRSRQCLSNAVIHSRVGKKWALYHFCSSCNWMELFFKLYWGIVDLHCCVNFCCTSNWFIHRYAHSLFHIGYHRALGRFPCTIQQVPVDHPLHIPFANPSLPPNPSPLVTISLLLKSLSVFLFCTFYCIIFIQFHILVISNICPSQDFLIL